MDAQSSKISRKILFFGNLSKKISMKLFDLEKRPDKYFNAFHLQLLVGNYLNDN
jgi:hypothetical protein